MGEIFSYDGKNETRDAEGQGGTHKNEKEPSQQARLHNEASNTQPQSNIQMQIRRGSPEAFFYRKTAGTASK